MRCRSIESFRQPFRNVIQQPEKHWLRSDSEQKFTAHTIHRRAVAKWCRGKPSRRWRAPGLATAISWSVLGIFAWISHRRPSGSSSIVQSNCATHGLSCQKRL
jgi:hypothetical protein